ncbi:hypothetical protein D3C86_1861340 [compost metagenome]
MQEVHLKEPIVLSTIIRNRRKVGNGVCRDGLKVHASWMLLDLFVVYLACANRVTKHRTWIERSRCVNIDVHKNTHIEWVFYISYNPFSITVL